MAWGESITTPRWCDGSWGSEGRRGSVMGVTYYTLSSPPTHTHTHTPLLGSFQMYWPRSRTSVEVWQLRAKEMSGSSTQVYLMGYFWNVCPWEEERLHTYKYTYTPEMQTCRSSFRCGFVIKPCGTPFASKGIPNKPEIQKTHPCIRKRESWMSKVSFISQYKLKLCIFIALFTVHSILKLYNPKGGNDNAIA